MNRPLIGVTTSTRSGWRIFPLVRFNLWLAGARAQRWTTRSDIDLDRVDGVIIGGGDDISPDLYGARLEVTARLDPDRDAMEHDIARQALGDGIPVLGICRGAQMLNIAAGGTLHQDAWSLYPDAKPVKTILPRREVCVSDASQLSNWLGGEPMRVNALHTQAVDLLGQGFRVAARDTHGMVQAIERCRDPFALGVQWHPEHLFYAHRQRAIFRALSAAAQAYAQGRRQVFAPA
ncbi:gamma-glutamyl-gamma-aminobutyrate hydrolase family protein [Mameliella sediminis]|uniref:gamma-glutamyl-gamma-aminobutyrate hydrolase family protein n=1 Tax=Mameliella sediminis TaxID=2836866 RepID=UPI001C44234A|nr:gamma-glutamyl-gamma-aminobutyrate hydrolase family protein [Mameliella sediminis]MBV7394225.1 gamma-glutamyl-gamma-aminobutyrate hydrolase family protein [Mameliella sediminis]MBY6162363.1 gamma-glutamyl-gamma-aminobutyrate hydrolase family protein [Mameliella alba]MBY6170837.1 gamma-glutamyl-gamma-aminobutyrate hydrolase family protein [Mameliella alba]MBY6175850.1 gamma-glutamyl-gamma-aminobutyrate hydrolase family protein [Mameliella alba]